MKRAGMVSTVCLPESPVLMLVPPDQCLDVESCGAVHLTPESILQDIPTSLLSPLSITTPHLLFTSPCYVEQMPQWSAIILGNLGTHLGESDTDTTLTLLAPSGAH